MARGVATTLVARESGTGSELGWSALRHDERRNSKRAFAVATPCPLPPAARHDRVPGGRSQAPPDGRGPVAGLRSGAPSTTRPSLRKAERGRRPNAGQEADQGVRPLRGRGGRRPRRRDLSGYSDARGGERDGSAEGDALTSPSRSSRARSGSPPVCTPTSRRRPPQRGHAKTSRAKTRRSSAAHIEALSRGDPNAPGDGAARGPAAVGPSSTASGPPGMTADRHPAAGPSTP